MSTDEQLRAELQALLDRDRGSVADGAVLDRVVRRGRRRRRSRNIAAVAAAALAVGGVGAATSIVRAHLATTPQLVRAASPHQPPLQVTGIPGWTPVSAQPGSCTPPRAAETTKRGTPTTAPPPLLPPAGVPTANTREMTSLPPGTTPLPGHAGTAQGTDNHAVVAVINLGGHGDIRVTAAKIRGNPRQAADAAVTCAAALRHVEPDGAVLQLYQQLPATAGHSRTLDVYRADGVLLRLSLPCTAGFAAGPPWAGTGNATSGAGCTALPLTQLVTIGRRLDRAAVRPATLTAAIRLATGQASTARNAPGTASAVAPDRQPGGRGGPK